MTWEPLSSGSLRVRFAYLKKAVWRHRQRGRKTTQIMKIFKTLVPSDAGAIYTVDTIQHQGGLWLVPRWLDVPEKRETMPARLIRMDLLPHQRIESGQPADFVLNGYMPKALFDFDAPLKSTLGFEVIELPEISFPARSQTTVGSAVAPFSLAIPQCPKLVRVTGPRAISGSERSTSL